MDLQHAAAAAAVAAAAIPPAAAVLAAPAAVAPVIIPPLYEIDFDTAMSAIGTFPPLQPHPTHSNIQALERTLIKRLETL
jgi:hypothetical protein